MPSTSNVDYEEAKGMARRATPLGLAAACLAVVALCIVWGSGGRGSHEEATLLMGEDKWEVGGRGARGRVPRELESEARTIERRQQDRVKRAASVLERAESKMERDEGIAGGMLDEARSLRETPGGRGTLRERAKLKSSSDMWTPPKPSHARLAQGLLSLRKASSKMNHGVNSDGGSFSSYSLSSMDGYRSAGSGDLGPFATSKWDDVQHHGRPCRLRDIDCDEMWPNTEAAIDSMPVERHPPKRDSKLGDNLVGIFGQDDVIVPLRRSGLVHYAHPNVDKLGPLPEDSKENRDLLYGSARVVNSNRFLGTGDRMVPLKRAEDLQSIKPHHGDHGNHPLEDLVFGSWQEGFNRPHSEKLKADVHMFDQVRSKNTSRSTHARQVEVSCTCKIIHARAGFDVSRHFRHFSLH